MNLDLLWGLLLGVLLNLDRQSFGHNMLGRPMVTGLLMGLVMGQTEAGLRLGLWTELLWLVRPPLGGFIPPNGCLAVSAGLLGWITASDYWVIPSGRPSLILTFILLPPLASLATFIESLSRRQSSFLAEKLRNLLISGQRPRFMWYNLRGLISTFIGSLLLLLITGPLAAVILSLSLEFCPPGLWKSLSQAEHFIPILGLVIVAINLPSKLKIIYAAGLAGSILLL